MKNGKVKSGSALLALAVAAATPAHSSEEHRDAHTNIRLMEEVIVTAPFDETAAKTALPVILLADEELLEKVTNTLGQTLRNEIGINNSSFGPSVGHPVIRGHTGNRVSVLQNGVGTTDVSKQSADHAEAVDLSLADRVEVVRGPASLLYGSGAVGGVINVIDGRVPESVPESVSFFEEQSFNNNGDENRTVVRVDGGSGNFAFDIGAFQRDNDNIEIAGFAIDEEAVEELEELIHGDHDHDEDHMGEEHDHEEEEVENTFGFIGNSNSESQGASIGFSYVGDNGFLGFAFSQLENDYGLPPGSHTHAHEHGEEHEGEHEESVVPNV